MTIKQHGGVFGRNPTFNNVTVEGDITGGSDLSLSGTQATITLTDTDGPNVGTIFQAGPHLYVDNDSTGEIRFRTSSNTERLSIEAAGDVKVSTGNLVIGTSGKGIDFSATSGTGTSELFDDYEEGTFTPVVEGTSTAGTYTYATQTGVYTKVGDLVTVTINLVDITESVAGSGSFRIVGLPFSASVGVTHTGTLWARSVNFDASTVYLVPYAVGTGIYVNEVVDNAPGGSWNIADLVSGAARLYITMTYKV